MPVAPVLNNGDSGSEDPTGTPTPGPTVDPIPTPIPPVTVQTPQVSGGGGGGYLMLFQTLNTPVVQTPVLTKAEQIAQIKAQLIALISQLIQLLKEQL